MDSEEKRREMEQEEKRQKEFYARLNEQRLEEVQFEKARKHYLPLLEAKIEEDEKRLEQAKEPEERRIELGSRCAADSEDKSWYCTNCSRDVKAERYLLVDLPRFTCPSCHQKAPQDLDFDFCMSRLHINGYSPIGNVKDQADKPQCVLYSSSSAAESSWRVNSILSGQEVDANGPLFDMFDIADKYEVIRLKYYVNRRNSFKWNFETLRAMRRLFSKHGAKSLGDDPKIYKFPHVACVKRSFISICKMLAQGFPMVAVMRPGENFANLKPGQIYRCPESGGVLHAIVLIGAGRHQGVQYYHFLNSWGRSFCLFGFDEGGPLGGYGLIYAEDILSTPLTFLRHESDLQDPKLNCYLLKGDQFPRFIPGRGNLDIIPLTMELTAFTLGVKKLGMAMGVAGFTRRLFNLLGIHNVDLISAVSKSTWLLDILEGFAKKIVLDLLSIHFKSQRKETIKGTGPMTKATDALDLPKDS